MNNIKYSLATNQELPFISETYHENIESIHGVYRNNDVWKELLADKNSAYYIVYKNNPVAWFRLDFAEDELWLGMLQVKQIYHRQGIGKYILSIVEDIAKQKNFNIIGIHTTEDNTAAMALYLSSGYLLTEIGPCTTADGKERVGYTLKKEI